MPLYEYACTECDNVVSMIESVDDRDQARNCVKCGAEMKRVLSEFCFKIE